MALSLMTNLHTHRIVGQIGRDPASLRRYEAMEEDVPDLLGLAQAGGGLLERREARRYRATSIHGSAW